MTDAFALIADTEAQGCCAFVGEADCKAKPTERVAGGWAIYLCTFRKAVLGVFDDGRPICLTFLCQAHLSSDKDVRLLLADAAPRVRDQQLARYWGLMSI